MKTLTANHKNQFFYAPWLVLIICLFLCRATQAQRPDHAFGIGFQAGNPTGLALQFYKAHGVSTDILIAYNLKDFLFVNIHGLWNTHLDQKGLWHLFYGPGGFVGIRDQNLSDKRYDKVEAGISGDFGVNAVAGRVEFFGQLTPRLSLTPATNFNLGGGVGMRFFFW